MLQDSLPHRLVKVVGVFLCLLATASPLLAELHSSHGPGEVRARILAEKSMLRLQGLRPRPESTAPVRPAVTADMGNIAVMEDDGTLFFQANAFDLDTKSLLFTRSSDGAYQVSAGSTPFDNDSAQAGQALQLKDDDTMEIQLGFSFPFYDQSYASVFLNSDGNLTFTVGDVAISERDLSRFLTGPPRIAPFFQDLNPAEGGSVTVNIRPDRVVFSWLQVPLCCKGTQDSPMPQQTFQATLFSDGRIQFIYNGVPPRAEAVVGISPGRVAVAPSLVDLSQQNGSQRFSGAIPEVFLNQSQLCITCVLRKFYSFHEDAYDSLVIWGTFPFIGRSGAFALGGPVRNDITGIQGADVPDNFFDFAREVGSQTGRLQGLVEANDLTNYPDDPSAVFLGENNTISVLGQEFGHRWLALVRYPTEAEPQSPILLGRDKAHWSFFFNSEASVVEGNEIKDNGDGSFLTINTVARYGTLDQYVMGLRAPEEVPANFVISPVTFTDPPGIRPSTGPRLGVTLRGTKVPVTIDKIIEANGPRWPPSFLAQKDFNFGFILVSRQGSPPSAAQVAKLDRIRTAWEQFWGPATEKRSLGRTSFFKAAKIVPLPAAVGSGATISATLNLGSPAPAPGAVFQLQSSDATVVSVPASIIVPAGAPSAAFQMRALKQGTATVSANADGYEPVKGGVVVTTGAVVNGASFAAGYPVSPGSIISIFGANLAGSTQGAAGVPLPTTLGNGSVSIGTAKAPLFFASSGQINAQVPFETMGGYAPVVVNNGSTTAANLHLLLVRAAPGIFTTTQNGTGPGAVLHAANGASVTAASPAKAGEFISIFATGLGAVSPSVTSGRAAPASPLSNTVEAPQVTIAGQPAKASFSGLAPGFVGLYQVNVQVPEGVSGSALPLVVTMLGAASNTATIAVQ